MAQFSELQMRTALEVGERQASVGSIINLRGGRQGEAIVSNLHGQYAEQTLNGNIFSVSSQAVVSTTAGTTGTWTGLGVANPTASRYNLVLLGFGCGQGAAGAAGAVGIQSCTNSGFASAVTIQNGMIGGRASVALADDGATIVSPAVIRIFGTIGSVATTGYGLVTGIWVDIGGSIIIPPGMAVASYTTAATTSALQFTFMWEEVPINT
jgi:hypothetical protein